MGRFLKIAVYVAVLFLGYLWIATVAKSCNKNAKSDVSSTEITDEMNVANEFDDDLFEDEGEDDGTASTDGMGGGSETFTDDNDAQPIDYTEIDKIIDKNPDPIAPEVRKRTESSTISNASGKYMLLAGSYLMEDNAAVMIRKLKKLGYENAEIVVFEMSQYHSVCAGRYASLSSAQQESGTLKRKGIDNYVHTKQ